MNLDNLQLVRDQLAEEKENQLVKLGTIIGKMELIDLLIVEEKKKGVGEQPAPLSFSQNQTFSMEGLAKLMGADEIHDPQPAQ